MRLNPNNDPTVKVRIAPGAVYYFRGTKFTGGQELEVPEAVYAESSRLFQPIETPKVETKKTDNGDDDSEDSKKGGKLTVKKPADEGKTTTKTI